MNDCLIGCITSDDEGRGYYCDECPEMRKRDTSGLVGPDGFTRLAPAVAEAQWNALEMARKADAAERRAEEAEYHAGQLREALDSAERIGERAAELATERDAALARIARAERLIDSWERDAPEHSNPVFVGRLRECLRRDPAPVRLREGDGPAPNPDPTASQTWNREAPVLCSCGKPIGHPSHCDSCCGCGVADQHERMARIEHLRRCPICDMRFDEPCDHHWLDRPESDTRECLICGVEVAG